MTEDSNVLWFTSTQSSKLQSGDSGSSFEGLYMCDNFSPETGTCSDAKLIVDSWELPGSSAHHGKHHGGGMHHGMMEHQGGKTHHPQYTSEHHHPQGSRGHKRGLDLMNVQIDESTNTLYTGYFDKYRNSFEILSAPLQAPVTLQSYLRTAVFSSNNACRMDCCEDAGHTYFKVQPRDFAVDNGEIFVSWDAFYQNCASSSYTAKAGLKWTVGVSKILSSNPDCVLHNQEDTDVEVNFSECTEPVAIAFQDSEARKKLLGYAGFAIGNSVYTYSVGMEVRKRLFFLSAMRQVDPNRLHNELWIVKEGDFNTASDVVEVDSVATIDPHFADISIDDVGTIRLRKDENGVPTGLCRTAYDAPIVCHNVRVDDDGNAELWSKNTYVSREKVAESCSVVKSDHYPASKLITSVATGLEVFWSKNSNDDAPDFLVFGCYGELNYHGNVTTAFRNKRTVQTIAGAYPGSVLKGIDVHRDPDVVPHDSFHAPNHDSVYQYSKKHHATNAASRTRSSGLLLACGLLVGAAAFVLRKKAKGRREVVVDYEPVVQVEIGGMSQASYVELDTPS